jgi:tRNA pseudouridine32 synthase/23S rRNA pseudouridine746 synthase
MLLTVPGRHPANFDCLISRVQQEFGQAQVVHRLDYDTSGLVILPLTKSALSHISKQFQARTIEKHYQALVHGVIKPAQGSIDLPIAADPERRPLYKICQQTGKASLTHYQTLSVDDSKQQSRLLLKPVTGRSHQLRLHLCSLGHAIVGDTLYATPEVAALSKRLCLHAAFIEFVHPVTLKTMQFSVAAEF